MIATLATHARPTRASTSSSSPATATRSSSCSDPHIKVLYNKRGVSDYALYDEAGIVERCGGVTPAQYTEYAALRGDTSDNLPGVPGIGEKTAAKLITTYGDLEGIFEHLDELPPKQRQNLGESQDRVFKNREMSRLDRDVDFGVEPTSSSRARSTSSRCACCSTSSSSARCSRGCSTRSAKSREVPEADALEVEVVIARDAQAAEAALLQAAEQRRGSRSSRAGRARPGASRARRARDRDRRRGHVPRRRRSSPTSGAHTALGALVGGEPAARRAPRQGADPRARRRLAGARARHRGDGVPARSRARGSTRSRTSRCATSRSS